MSDQDVRALITDTQQWLAELAQSGWTGESTSGVVAAGEPGVTLFGESDPPLVVGLFGGTGVGKSSLLNRLAGGDVARTGVIRPTSMEITAYLDEQISMNALPENFPADSFSQARHRRDDLSNVVWVDMPDFDSDETQNRAQVLQWLPHIDLLVYVVTPERYRDAEGWKLLLQEGYRHGWLFVMNQWDRADPVQLDDLTALLKSTGFREPRVFRTICSGAQEVQDDFDDLARLVSSLAQRKIIEQLNNRGWLSRLLELRSRVSALDASLDCDAPDSAMSLWRERWSAFVDEAIDNQRLDVAAFARQFEPAAEANIVKRLVKSGTEDTLRASMLADRSQLDGLWDQWGRKRLQSALDRYVSDVSTHGLAAGPLVHALEGMPDRAEQTITDNLRARLKRTIERPGPQWRRSLHAVCRRLQWILPVAALGWAGWRVVGGFIAGADDPGAYVGFSVLPNALMLAGLGWLLACLATLASRPAVSDWVARDLLGQMREDLTAFGREQEDGIAALVEQRREIARRLQQFDSDTRGIFERASLLENEELTQLLLPHPASVTPA